MRELSLGENLGAAAAEQNLNRQPSYFYSIENGGHYESSF